MTSRTEKARQRAERDIARAEREDHIAAMLPAPPDGLRSWRLYSHKRETWATIEPQRESYSEPETSATWVDIARLAAELPAIPLALHKGGTTAIRPADEPARREGDDITPIAAVILHAEGPTSYSPATIAVRWWTDIGGERVRVSIMMRANPLAPLYGDETRPTGSYTVERSGRKGRGRYIQRCDYTPPAGSESLAAPDGRGLAVAERIRWASGGREHPNPITVYWLPLGGAEAGPAELARNVMAEAEGAE